MEHLPINDLPNELLEIIFDHLNVDDLKNASLVCKRWLDLAFPGRRMDRVMLVPKFPYDIDFLQSNRKYRHIKLEETRKDFAYVKKLFQAFSVSSLRIEDRDLSLSSLRLILLEVPNLQHLSIVHEPKQMNETIKPLPVMRKLERLEIEYHHPKSAIPWHSIAPSLKGLKMDCDYEDQLEQWRLFSGQLNQVSVTCNETNLLARFCEMTFPPLEELSINLELSYVGRHEFAQGHDFFRRNTSLRLLRLEGIYLSQTLVEDITNYCKKLTSLEIRNGNHCNLASLESLSQLTELKHLRLENLDTYIFHGCKVLTSLQSLSMTSVTSKCTFGGTPSFLVHLVQIAPQLRCLELGSVMIRESVVLFICNSFLKLTRLQLSYSEKVSRDFLSGIGRLPHLRYLELTLFNINRESISSFPQNKVRYLTLHLPVKYCELDLLWLLEFFPQLDRLNLVIQGQSVRESTVDNLRKILTHKNTTCAIKLYSYLLTIAEIKRGFRKWTRSEMMPWEKE